MTTRRKITNEKLPYTVGNVRVVISAIKRNLSADLLPKKWQKINQKNKMFGHCHTASGCFYKVFGPKYVHLYRAKDTSRKLVDEDMFHWWIVDKHNKVIDITNAQYRGFEKTLTRLHHNGQKSSILGFNYKTRVNELLNRISRELNL